MSVKPGMSPKEIAILHYQLLIENKKEEWEKTISKQKVNSSAPAWWKAGRHYVADYGVSYKFKNEDEKFRTGSSVKFFFHRIVPKDSSQSTMPVPIHVKKDPQSNNEWRVDVSSW